MAFAISDEDLQKAAAVRRVSKQASDAVSAVDTASRMGIVIETAQRGPRGQQSIPVMPTDPEWADLVRMVKDISARRQTVADQLIDSVGLSVTDAKV